MKGDPLKVRFKEGPVTPFHANNARPVPAHLEAPGRALCDDLVRKGVLRILDENTVTDWLSRGHFVPKPGRPDQARLVTDYVKLDAFIRRPIHPFPSTHAICKMVKGTDKWFCKLDAVHGYFQLPLEGTLRSSSSRLSSSPGASTLTLSRPWVSAPPVTGSASGPTRP